MFMVKHEADEVIIQQGIVHTCIYTYTYIRNEKYDDVMLHHSGDEGDNFYVIDSGEVAVSNI